MKTLNQLDSSSAPHSIRRFSGILALAAALALLLSACGSDPEEVVAGAGGDDTEQGEQADDSPTQDPVDQAPADEAAEDDDAMNEDPADGDSGVGGSELTPTESHPELISAQPAPISEVASIDDQTLGVRYQAGAEPCALANVTIIETDSAIEVALETGLHPNAAAMSCIAQVFDYEIQVALDQPIGDREIVIQTP